MLKKMRWCNGLVLAAVLLAVGVAEAVPKASASVQRLSGTRYPEGKAVELPVEKGCVKIVLAAHESLVLKAKK